MLGVAVASVVLAAQPVDSANPLLRYRGGFDRDFRYELTATLSVEPQKQKLGSPISERYVFAENSSQLSGILTLTIEPTAEAAISVTRNFESGQRSSRGLFESVRPEFEQRLLRDAPPVRLTRRLQAVAPENVLLPWLAYPLYPLEEGETFQTELTFAGSSRTVNCSSILEESGWRLECDAPVEPREPGALDATFWIDALTGWPSRVELDLRRLKEGYTEVVQVTLNPLT
ncbi:MAG: hypothetical protein ACOCX1_02655 [Fimbriimonadaceae bacterium]